VLYAVVRNGVGKPSGELLLTVESLAESVLEAPRILQAVDDLNLDVSALTGDADLTVRPWPFIEVGQLISLRFEGTKADGTDYNWAHPTWQDLPIGSTGEPSTTVALSDLKELKDGSSLRLIFEVSFDGGVTKVPFPVRVLSVIQLATGFEDFESVVPGPIPSTYLTLPSGFRVLTDGRYNRATIVRAGSQQDEHGFQYLSLASYCIVDAQLPQGNFRKLTFTMWIASVGHTYLECWVLVRDSSGDTQERNHILREGKVSFEYTVPLGRTIVHIHFFMNYASGSGVLACDSFRWSE